MVVLDLSSSRPSSRAQWDSLIPKKYTLDREITHIELDIKIYILYDSI